MNPSPTNLFARSRASPFPHLWIVTVFLVGSAGPAFGQLLFTVEPGGPSGLGSELVYFNNVFGSRQPKAGGPASGLSPGDMNDGFSQRKTQTEFLLCFSVDPHSVGGPPIVIFSPPLPTVGSFNVTYQAARAQAAGDAFISTEAYSRAAGLLPAPPGMGLFNNVLAVNQAAPFFPVADFALLPHVAPFVDLSAAPPPLDDINGGSAAPPGPLGGPIPGTLTDLFFTLGTGSASLGGGAPPYLGGSGADIFFDPTPGLGLGAGDESIFATAALLGLVLSDDIDALVVFDDDLDGDWSAGDQVLFSLDAGSPTLGGLGASPADVLSITFGGPLGVFALAGDLGLAIDDDINMLDLVALDGTAENTIRLKVPEPTSLALLAVIGLGMVGLRRRARA